MPEPHGTLQEGAIVLLGPSLGSPDVTVSNKRGKSSFTFSVIKTVLASICYKIVGTFLEGQHSISLSWFCLCILNNHVWRWGPTPVSLGLCPVLR